MTNKTLWFGFIAVFIVAQLLGYLVHEMLLADAYMALQGILFRPVEEIQANMWMMMVSAALYLFLFCYIYTKGHEGKGIMEGVRYGLLMGLFMSIPMSLDTYSVYPLTTEIVGTWFVTGVIQFMIYGAIIAAIYKPQAAATG
jgi:hypothetical protein